jgi:hypothetical protein
MVRFRLVSSPNRFDGKARHGGGTQKNAMPERPHAVDDTYPSHMR